MNRKSIIRIIAVLLAVLMALSLVSYIFPVMAHAVSQSDINALKQKRDEISEKVKEAEAYVQTLEKEQANVLDQKTALEEQNAVAKEALALVAEEIAMYDGIIAEKTEELNAAINREEIQLEKYRTRVRAMEESGGYNILAVLMSSGDFNEFLTAVDDMEKIMTSDRELEDEYIAAREESERIKAEYEEVRAECESRQKVLKAEEAEIEKHIAETEEKLAELEEQLEQAVDPVVRKAGFGQVKNLFFHHCGVSDCLPCGGLVCVYQPRHPELGAAEIAHHNRQHIGKSG